MNNTLATFFYWYKSCLFLKLQNRVVGFLLITLITFLQNIILCKLVYFDQLQWHIWLDFGYIFGEILCINQTYDLRKTTTIFYCYAVLSILRILQTFSWIFLTKVIIRIKFRRVKTTGYKHTMAKSLILCGPNSKLTYLGRSTTVK